MDLRTLKYFVAVFENGSFSAASKSQFISQPSISASIKQLEQNLSQQLFFRETRGVVPTEAGQQLYPLAKQLLGQALAIEGLFVEKPFKVPFRLGLIKGLGVERMSSLLKRFTASAGTMELTLVPSEDHCDARIISKELLVSGEQFVPMWRESYLLAMPVDHPLCLQDQIELNHLSKLAFIQRSPCEGWSFLRERLQLAAIELDIRARIQTVEYAIGLVKAGLGCAFIPVSQDTAKHRELTFRSIKEHSLTRQIGLAYKQDSGLIKSLVQSVKSK